MISKNEQERTNKNWFIIIILLLIILLLLFLLIISMMGKIGYIETSSSVVELIEITEDDVNWNLLEQLNIFNGFKKIAPGNSGTYAFKISNKTNRSLIYDIQLKEINEYGINIKYKIKTNEKYIVGNENEALQPEKINIENIILNPNEEQEYILVWKWEETEHDTQIGMLEKADYTLRIKIGAEEYNK